MPRFVRLLLAQLRRNILITVVLVASLILAIAYTMGPKPEQLRTSESVEIKGVAPSEDVGILGGLAGQRIETENLRKQLGQLRKAISQMEQTPKPQEESETVRALQDQIQRMQMEMDYMRGQPARDPYPVHIEPSSPPIVIRSVRRGRGESTRSAPVTASGIQVLADAPTQASAGTPYLPPQSYAAGHVIDGYTGLASEQGFPLTIAIDQPFLTPNSYTVPVHGCRLGAKATTEELTARSRAMLTNITCVDGQGQTLERPIEGYITAADNIHGGFAQVFWHERELVKAFMKSSIPVALVSLFRETRRTISASSLTGSVVSSGNSVAQQVAGRMANIYLDKAEKLASPVVWVPPNAPVTIYITKGAALDPYLQATPASHTPLATRLAK